MEVSTMSTTAEFIDADEIPKTEPDAEQPDAESTGETGEIAE
jgi:hypothetical protein